MDGSLSRRTALRAGGLAAATALGGCLWNNPETAAGHVYAENTSGGERQLGLVIAEQSDGTVDPEVQGRYRVPDEHALEFENLLNAGQTYVVQAALSGSPPQDRVANTVDPCGGGGGGDRRIVAVRTRPDGLGIIPFGCEESYTQRDLEYVQASEYRTESLDGLLTDTADE